MATDRSLTAILWEYTNPQDAAQSTRILSTTLSLLSTLSNPLNITLLTSQLLTARAIWIPVDRMSISFQILNLFKTASMSVRQNQLDEPRSRGPKGGRIHTDVWARAVIQGADKKSPRWRHLLVIGGILIGMEGQGRQGLSRGLRSTLETALVRAANLALEEPDTMLGVESAILGLALSFDLLSDHAKRGLNYDALAPNMIRSIISAECYQGGSFLGAINADVAHAMGNKLEWSPKSASFSHIKRLATKPLIISIGPLSRLTAHALKNLREPSQVPVLLDKFLEFTGMVATQWRLNKLSELEPAEEAAFLTLETVRVTLPALWQILKTLMFATINILRSIIGRILVDPVLASDIIAPSSASKTLQVLRNIYFISSRLGSNTFTAYTFTFFTSIDILSRFSVESRIFLFQIRSTYPGQIPRHPLDRNLDLFFLNTCEHFTLALTPQDNESLVVATASPYLSPVAHERFMEIFEAAHSAMLASLAAPRNTELTARILPFYVEALFSSFPANLSPRQFRFAFRALLQITTPPAPLSATQPLLPDTLLELIYHRATHASTEPLPSAPDSKGDADAKATGKLPPLSEQAILMLILLDALPFLSYRSLEEWLPLSAGLLRLIDNPVMGEVCRARFWEVLESGEMDVDRAAICVAWWSNRGGRDLVSCGRERNAESKAHSMIGELGPRDESHL